MPVLRDGPHMSEEPGHAGPAEAGNGPQVSGLIKVRQQGIDLGGHGCHLGREHIHPRHCPLHFAREDVQPVRAGNCLRRIAVNLRQFKAPHSAAGAMRAHLGNELTQGHGGQRRGGEAGTQNGQGTWLQQICPDSEELGEKSVELMGNQHLEPRPLLAEPAILAPGAPQRQVGAGLQLGPGDQTGSAELGDLLGIASDPSSRD